MNRAKRITLLVAVGLMAMCGSAQADLYFTNQAPAGASWFTAGNWRDGITPFGSAVPTTNDTAIISTTTGPGTVIVDGPGGVVKGLTIGWWGHQGNLQMQPGGELYVHTTCYVGYRSPSQLVITGGVFSGISTLYIGAAPPAAPAPPCVVEVVQYAGALLMTNGSASLSLNSTPGSGNYAEGYPRYRLLGGTLQSGYSAVGASAYGKFEIEGGTNKVNNYLRLGYAPGGNGVYLQSGGLVTCYWLLIGASETQGRYELSGGFYSGNTLYCGYGGKGTFVQSGGTNTPGTLNIGGPTTGPGIFKISGGKLAAGAINVSTNGTFEITGSEPTISCNHYTQLTTATLDLRLTNGLVSPITVNWAPPAISGTLNVTLQGSQEFYPDRSSVVTVMTHPTGSSGPFETINLAPANKLISVRVNYNEKSITLDQWKYAPNGSLLSIR